ncbi:MAG: dTMP kinase [bacterium]
MFITFEGIDGCGKSTHIRRLAEYLETNGQKVLMIREPGGTVLSEKIRSILLSHEIEINPNSELLLFEAARAQLVAEVIVPGINEGFWVIADRFFDSTLAYQGYGRKIDHFIVNRLNAFATGGLIPDLTFYLQIPLEISAQRTGEREKDRMECSGDEFNSLIHKGFEEIAISNPERVIVIDSSESEESTFNQIIKEIKKRNII